MNLQEVLSRPTEFQYQLLAVLKMDCDCFLGASAGDPNYLWADTPEEQIEYMTAIWEGLEVKPKWLTEEQLESYKVRMP